MNPSETTRRLVRAVLPRGLRNAIRHPQATMRAFLQRSRAWLKRYDAYEVRPGWTVTCHPSSTQAFRAQNENADCRAELDGFIRLCRPGMILLDAGSHFGIFVLAAIQYGGPDARVLAVDPSAECATIFETNLRLSNALSQTHIVRAAVGDRDGQLEMLTTGAGGDFFMVASEVHRADAVSIPQLTLASLAAMCPGRVTHLKMDVEGHEVAIVPGNREWLRATKPLLFLELHGDLIRSRGQDPLATLQILEECGYERWESNNLPITITTAASLSLARIIGYPTGT